MNVTFNTTNLNSRNYNKNNNLKNNNRPMLNVQPSFTGKSSFLKPFDRAMDSIAEFIAKHYTKYVYQSTPAKWLASKGKKTGNVVDHMQTMGSVVISGMYMTQTLRNKDLDERRKKTLAVNQGLTFLASTAIAYLFEKLFLGPWDRNVTLKYAKNFLNDPKLGEKYQKYVDKAKVEFEKNAANANKEFKVPTAASYIDKVIKNKKLSDKIKGLNVLKSLVIFGSVYRFIGPVAVTPIANWIGNKLFSEEPENKTQPQIQTQNIAMKSRPQISSLTK